MLQFIEKLVELGGVRPEPQRHAAQVIKSNSVQCTDIAKLNAVQLHFAVHLGAVGLGTI